MAKITYTGLTWLSYEYSYFQPYFLTDVAQDGKSATLSFEAGGNIVLTGENLEGNDELTAGTVTGISYQDEDGDVYATAVDVTLEASKIANLLAASYKGIYADGLARAVNRGNDTLTGSDKDDTISGWRGNDRIFGHRGGDFLHGDRGNDKITGGQGEDNFYFNRESGHDVITDFDADGDRFGRKQDELWFSLRKGDSSNLDIVEDNHGWAELIAYDGAVTVTLKGVSVDQIDRSDYRI